MRRLSAVVALTGLFALLLGGVASAAWNLVGTGSGSGKASSLAAPTSPSAATVAPTSSSIDISFSPASNPPGTTYTVTRDKTASGAAGATVACSGLTASPCHDTGLATGTTFTYTVAAVLGSWSAAAATTPSATTTGGPGPFLVSAPATATAGTAFNVTVTARFSSLATDTTYTGSHALTFTGPGTSILNNAPSYPASANFVNGVATVSITLFKAETTSITVADATPARNGTSGSIVVSGTGTASALMWSASATGATNDCVSPKTIVGNGGQVVWYVAVVDAYGNATLQGASARGVTIAKVSGGGNAPTQTSLTVNANGPAVTSASTTLKLPLGSPADTTYSATSGALSVSCVIAKN